MKAKWIILFAIFIGLSACSKKESDVSASELTLRDSSFALGAASATNNSVNILGKWNFLYYSDKKAHKYETTLEFKDERASGGTLNLSGKLVMNFYTATFKLDGDKITIGNIGTTKVGVQGADEAFEQKFVESLKNATRLAALDKNTLLIYLSQPKDEVMYFSR